LFFDYIWFLTLHSLIFYWKLFVKSNCCYYGNCYDNNIYDWLNVSYDLYSFRYLFLTINRVIETNRSLYSSIKGQVLSFSRFMLRRCRIYGVSIGNVMQFLIIYRTNYIYSLHKACFHIICISCATRHWSNWVVWEFCKRAEEIFSILSTEMRNCCNAVTK